MFSIFPLLLILVALAVIVVIVAKKYPELTLLDLESIAERKEKQKKKELFSRKASQRSRKQHARFLDRVAPVGKAWKGTQTSFRKYVRRLKDDVEEPTIKRQSYTPPQSSHAPSFREPRVFQPIEPEIKEETVEDILRQAQRAFEQNNPQAAEASYIRAIEKDTKNARAYEGLGDVYLVQGQTEEAEQTYQYAHKLAPQAVSVLEKLARMSMDREAWTEAIQYYEQAVLVEDTNPAFFATLADLFLKAEEPQSAYEAISQAVDILPKNISYLDMLVEISIMVGDADRAEEGIQAIRMIDPEYVRLDVFRDRILEMGHSDSTEDIQ